VGILQVSSKGKTNKFTKKIAPRDLSKSGKTEEVNNSRVKEVVKKGYGIFRMQKKKRNKSKKNRDKQQRKV
jgi:hypothetical protein